MDDVCPKILTVSLLDDKISPFCPKILPKLDDKNLSFIQKTFLRD